MADPRGPCATPDFTSVDGIDWAFLPSEFTLWACRDGVGIDAVFDGPGEVYWWMDSNADGIGEVVIGGTTVGGGGGTVYSLIDERITPIYSPIGHLTLSFGHTLFDRYVGHGCANGQITHVSAGLDDDRLTVTTVVYEIHRQRAMITDVHQVAHPVAADLLEQKTNAVEGQTAALRPCWSTQAPMDPGEMSAADPDRPVFVLAGSSHRILVEELPPTNGTCEVAVRRPRLLIRAEDGSTSPWSLPDVTAIEVFWIEPYEFVSTPDGRFAYLDTFTCSHEGPIKSLLAGTWDPLTGALIDVAAVPIPEALHRERWGFPIEHPDALTIDESGTIVAWFEDAGDLHPMVVSER